MKKILVLCIALLHATLLFSKPYIQHGIVYLYDYKTKTKKPVANVSLTVAYSKGPAVSRTDGSFTIEFQDFGAGKKLAFEKQPFSQGLIVLNKKEVDEWSTFEGKLTLIMCNKKDFNVCKQNYYDVGFQSVTQRYERKIATLKQESADYQQRLQELEEERDRIIDNLRKSADAMARIDQSELDAAMQEVLDLYEQGNVEEAMQKLEDMKLKETWLQTRKRKHFYEKGVEVATQDSLLILAKLRSSIDLYKQNNQYDKAGGTLKLLADTLNTYQDNLDYINFCYFILKDKNATIIYVNKVKNLIDSLYVNRDEDYYYKKAVLLNYEATLLMDSEYYNESYSVFKEALKLLTPLYKASPKRYEIDYAGMLNNFSNLCLCTEHYIDAEVSLANAIMIYRQMNLSDSDSRNDNLATMIRNLGRFYYETKRFSESEKAFRESLEILKKLSISEPIYEDNLAQSYSNIALLYEENGKVIDSASMYQEAIKIRKRLYSQNPKAQGFILFVTLSCLSNLYFTNQLYTESEKLYRETLILIRHLAEIDPTQNEPHLEKTLRDLGVLYFTLGRYSESEKMYREALEICRRLAMRNPKAYKPYVALSQYQIGRILIEKEQYADAILSFEEALDKYRKLADYDSSKQEMLLSSLCYLNQLYATTNNHIRNYEIRQELFPIMKILYEKNQEDMKNDFASLIGSLSFNAIFMKKYSEAEQRAREGLSVDSAQHWIASNLAAAILLQGRFTEAELIYRQYKDELKDNFLDDFEQFKAAGVIPKEREEDVAKIKQILEE